MSNRVKEFQRSFDSRQPIFKNVKKNKNLGSIEEEDVIIGSQNIDSARDSYSQFSPTRITKSKLMRTSETKKKTLLKDTKFVLESRSSSKSFSKMKSERQSLLTNAEDSKIEK